MSLSDQNQLPISQLRSGDGALLGILASDFLGALAGAVIHFTMVWWVLAQDVPDRIVGLMLLAIFIPFNLGVLLSGVAVLRFGSRKLLVFSKLVAVGGAMACGLLLASNMMTLLLLAVVATITYGAMGPSVSADISRVPALTRLAKRGLAGFHALNGTILVLAQIAGFWAAALMAEDFRPEMPVAIGVAGLLLSTLVTWSYFPRDRPQSQNNAPVWLQIKQMTRGVLGHLDSKTIGLAAILATAAIIAASEGYSEVILPLDFRGSGLPATALAWAYAAAVVAGVSAAYVAQAIHEKTVLIKALKLVSLIMLAGLILGALIQTTTSLMMAVVLTSAAASGIGTMTVTALQENMPASLQAQAVSLWQALVLATGAFTILVTGQLGDLSFWFMALIGFAAVIACFWPSRAS